MVLNTIIHRQTKKEIMLAVLELEKRGFECVKPIHRVVHHNKHFERDSDSKHVFKGTNEYVHWEAVLKIGL